MTQSRNLLGETIAIIVIILVLAAIFFPVTGSEGHHFPQYHAISSIKQVALGALMYEADEDCLPAKENWGAALKPYIKSEGLKVYQPRKAPTLFAQERPATYFAFNEELSEATKLKDDEDPRSEDVMFFGSAFVLPYEWGPLSAARTYDESRGFLVAFRRGSAKWLKTMPIPRPK